MTEKLYIFTLDLGVFGCVLAIAKNLDIAFGIMKEKGTFVKDISKKNVRQHEIVEGFLYENTAGN